MGTSHSSFCCLLCTYTDVYPSPYPHPKHTLVVCFPLLVCMGPSLSSGGCMQGQYSFGSPLPVSVVWNRALQTLCTGPLVARSRAPEGRLLLLVWAVSGCCQTMYRPVFQDRLPVCAQSPCLGGPRPGPCKVVQKHTHAYPLR